ncbi:DUF4157 domain-containing protein [Aquimarina sp. SS2-1]|uniref:eCIS core domain-containing protein n=1 Tax=Aquimarina besae TaxID=3342247 RepID=UPI0036707BFB
MKASLENTQEPQQKTVQRVEQELGTGGEATIVDNRPTVAVQCKLRSVMGGLDSSNNSIQRKNNTGLPDNLKSGIENLSGYSMDDVKVHYNSSKPAQLQAHAYAQGTDIHLAPGQEKHLPHEAWHVVQQKQGRVQPTMQFKGKVAINDDAGLEKEADVMGELSSKQSFNPYQAKMLTSSYHGDRVTQLRFRGGPNTAGNGVTVYDVQGNVQGRLIPGAEFDLHDFRNIRSLGRLRKIVAMNREDYVPIGAYNNNDKYVKVAHTRNVGGNTYTAEKEAHDQAANTITNNMGLQHGNTRYAVSETNLPPNEYTQACYNFAVGSFNAINGIKHLQAAIPSYIDIRCGGLGGVVLSGPNTLNLMDVNFANAITPAIMAQVDQEIANAGINLVVGANVPGGLTAAQRNVLWLPLQKLILRLSGLRPNPDGQWAIGFRGHNNALGSDHAWIEAYSNAHFGYISFDTFPNATMRVSRNRHSDPFIVPNGQLENRIRITGPTAAQMALINLAPNRGGLNEGHVLP